MIPELNEDQITALASIYKWINGGSDTGWFFVLQGYAGTGKTFCMRRLAADTFRQMRVAFTAPTNKATRVLQSTLEGSLGEEGLSPSCLTIYSLLGLYLTPSGEAKVLKGGQSDLSDLDLVVVDEASMLSSDVIEIIKQQANFFGVKFLFVGDPAQLPPVGEEASRVWKIKDKVELTKVVRHDNQILTLATQLRESVVSLKLPEFKSDFSSDKTEGVWLMDDDKFFRGLHHYTKDLSFTQGRAKVIAWRNASVDALNKSIRCWEFEKAFGRIPVQPYEPGDRIILTAPVKDSEGLTLATTDSEGLISNVYKTVSPVFPEYMIFMIEANVEGMDVAIHVVHTESAKKLESDLNDLATAARNKPWLWDDFWKLKDAFHTVKLAYAITAHRSQGSSYDVVFVNTKDILANRRRKESLQCLYVACTRARRKVVLL